MGGNMSLNSLFFGGRLTNAYRMVRCPEETPLPEEEPTSDPCMGFPSRTKRRTALTADHYYSLKLEAKDRDYCADLLADYKACRRDHWPWPVFCGHEKHAYLGCVYDDYVLRMKEYERERRLLARGLTTKPAAGAVATETSQDGS